jgi:hypothetical protein
MIILIVNQYRVQTIEAKRQVPVPICLHGPVSFPIPFEGVQVPAGGAHILGSCCRMQGGKLKSQLIRVSRLYARL